MEKNSSRVLIIDDLPVNRMILSSLLASRGVMSDQADGGYAGLDMVRSNDYDLILLDHRMPDLDGVDTLIRMKEIFKEQGRSIPVICHTVEEGRDNINLYKAAGFADVLIKPVTPEQLSELILTYLPQLNDTSGAGEDGGPDAGTGSDPGSDSTVYLDDNAVKDELDKLPLWLKIVPHIDLNAGIRGCGSAEDYVDALYVFRSSINDKADDIAYYEDQNDWNMYRLAIHSLKSMSLLIGAKNLSEMAAGMEKCADKKDYNRINEKTPELLAEYRRFNKLLEPLMEDEDIRQIMTDAADQAKETPKEAVAADHSRSVLFIKSSQGIVAKGIEKNLSDGGFNVVSVPDSPDAIINHRFDTDIIIYYPETYDDSHISITMNLLGELCQDDSKLLCLTGDVNDIELAMESKGAGRVTHTYPRPVEPAGFLDDMEYYSELLSDYHRVKTIFVVDDDPDYRSLIERWLAPHYSVSGFTGANEMMSGLSMVKPDLILLDYEMPEMDGYELMGKLRNDPETRMIPIIFLTGKNDRDHVYSILHYKPDGYLLKTLSKDSLLDSIDRFFAESLFRMSLHHVIDDTE